LILAFGEPKNNHKPEIPPIADGTPPVVEGHQVPMASV